MNRKLLFLFFIVSFSAQGQTIYVSTPGGLRKLNANTCDSTSLGNVGNFTDIAMTPDNRLYGLAGGSLVEFDTSGIFLSSIPTVPPFTSTSLVSDSMGNLLAVQSDSVYQINRFTGQVISLGYYGPFQPAGDLTFYHDTLYLSSIDLSSFNLQLVKIILQPNISSQLIGTMAANNILGLITICLNNTETIIACAYNAGNYTFSSLYIVNPADATLTLLCDSILHSLIQGAASQMYFSGIENCFISGINSPASVNEFTLSPNPATSEIKIESAKSKIESVEVFDVVGVKVKHLTPALSEGEGVRVEVSSLAAGIYFVRVKTEKGSVTRKLIKQ
jgi:hypothetical protein